MTWARGGLITALLSVVGPIVVGLCRTVGVNPWLPLSGLVAGFLVALSREDVDDDAVIRTLARIN
jgi:hypothetical protein